MTARSNPRSPRSSPSTVAFDSDAGWAGSSVALKMWAVRTASGSPSPIRARNGSSSTSVQTSVTSTTPRWVSAVALPRPGKCLIAEPHPRRVMCLDEGAGVRGDHGGVRREAAPDRGDARVVRVDGEVDDRCQVEGHTNIGERLGDLAAAAHRSPTELPRTEVRGRSSRREAIGGTQPRNLSALLVDGHQQWRRRRGAGQCGDQAAQLIGRLDVSRATTQLVAAEEDDSAERPVRDRVAGTAPPRPA